MPVLLFARETLCATAADEIEDDGDDREDQENVDGERAYVENHEATDPEHEQDNANHKKHGSDSPGVDVTSGRLAPVQNVHAIGE